jgi:hypothetical protein
MKHFLLAGLLLPALAACSEGYNRGVVEQQPLEKAVVSCKRQEVYCCLTNFSLGDTLLTAPARLLIDDSLIVAEQVPRIVSGNERFVKMLRLCEGLHRVHVQFGPYVRDTTFAVRPDTAISLMVAITCRGIPELAHEDGLAIATLVHDGKGGKD